MVHLQRLRRRHPRDLETISYPHAVPFKKSGSCLRTAQLVPGSARGRIQLLGVPGTPRKSGSEEGVSREAPLLPGVNKKMRIRNRNDRSEGY